MKTSRRSVVKSLSLGSLLLSSPRAFSVSPRGSTPAASGVSSKGIRAFLDAIAESRHELHSFMMLRRGRVLAEGWWNPYRREDNHGMYSMSKSFTSTAVGLAVAEGRLKVEDKVASFFPDDLPARPDKHLAEMSVRHLLTMSAGQDRSATGATIKGENWVRNFLALPIPDKPGSVFNYNSAATYMLSAIVHKLSGQSVVEYLKPRLFDPLGIAGPTWEVCPRGINTGGWGLNIRTEGLARLGQLYLQEGRWGDRQILPASWVAAASSKQIQQPVGEKSNPDWVQGYGYQFWRCRHDGFRGDGAFGQFTLVLPKQETVIVMTGESPDMQEELNLVWEHLLPAIDAKPSRADDAALKAQLAALAVGRPEGKHDSPTRKRVEGRTFQLEANPHGLRGVSFAESATGIVVTFTDDRGGIEIPCGTSEWIRSDRRPPFGVPRLIAGGAPKAGEPYRLACRAAWKSDNELELHLRYYETPHSDTITCRFDRDRVTMSVLGSITRIRNGRKDGRDPVTGVMGG